jgi:hypothetical protein
MTNLTLDNNYFNFFCNTIRAEEITIPTLPNAGFLKTDEDGKIIASSSEEPMPTSFMNFCTQWQNTGVPISADSDQFFGFYTEVEDGPRVLEAKFTCKLSQGIYNAYVLAYNDPNFVNNNVVVSFKYVATGQTLINVNLDIPKDGYNIISVSPNFTLNFSGLYEVKVAYNTRVGVTQFFVEQPPLV